MTDALSTGTRLDRPPVSGPGSGKAEWRAYVEQETGRTDLGEKSRDELVSVLDHTGPDGTILREAPEDVEVHEGNEDEDGRIRAPRIDGPNGPQWAVPVEDGFVAEDDLVTAERDAEKERKRERHADRLAQLKKRK